MRTPKIEALHRAINWFNTYDNLQLECLNLDNSPVNSNAWLAGFTDGDGNFSISLIDRKKKGIITSKRVQTFFRIELRQDYHRDVPTHLGGTSYFDILTKIARYLNVNLYSRTSFLIRRIMACHAKARRSLEKKRIKFFMLLWLYLIII